MGTEQFDNLRWCAELPQPADFRLGISTGLKVLAVIWFSDYPEGLRLAMCNRRVFKVLVLKMVVRSA